MATIKMTPMGIDPEACDVCGEWIGASNRLVKTSRGHVACFNTLLHIQEIAASDNPDVGEILALTIKTIGDRRE
jgi:hypothetical protein